MNTVFAWRRWMWLIPHLAALTPAIWLGWSLWQTGWPIDPVADFTALSGDVALKLLIATLAITPLLRLGAPKWLGSWRRPLGVYAFAYVCGHVLVYAGLDYAWDWELMSANLLSKRYLIAGSTAALVLLPLALTSTTGWQRRLRHWWKWLHRLVYVAALWVIVHYIWLVKSDTRVPYIYGAIVVVLLVLRIIPQRWLSQR
jgi:methionine sulfoxide reductase heme-binding subunit